MKLTSICPLQHTCARHFISLSSNIAVLPVSVLLIFSNMSHPAKCNMNVFVKTIIFNFSLVFQHLQGFCLNDNARSMLKFFTKGPHTIRRRLNDGFFHIAILICTSAVRLFHIKCNSCGYIMQHIKGTSNKKKIIEKTLKRCKQWHALNFAY